MKAWESLIDGLCVLALLVAVALLVVVLIGAALSLVTNCLPR